MIPWEISINSPSDTPSNGAEQATSELWTIKRLLSWTTDFFREHGAGQSRLDAEILLSEALGCPRIELYTRFDEEPPETVRGIFRDWVARHAEGEPVAYLVGQKEFFSLKFEVTPAVLIPRPETEHLVTEAIDLIRDSKADSVPIIDVGTGSGCVAIAICKHAPQANMTACDISDAALDVARQNAQAQGVSERIDFVKSDLLTHVPQPTRFHLIVSNPPYIGLSEKADLDKSVIDFEPHLALFSTGPDGTETIQQLLEQSAERLELEGYLLFEISPMIAEHCCSLIQEHKSLQLERVVKDLAGHARIVIAKRIA